MPQRDDQAPPGVMALGRLLEICVYAPLGAGARLIDDAPSAVARARQELSNARFIGRMVVAEGESRLRERMSDDAEPAAVRSTPASDRPVDATPVERVDPAADAPDEPHVEAVDVADAVVSVTDTDLALPDYDHLPAIDVIDQLESLTGEELDRIERYERDNRRRRTVLGKIAETARRIVIDPLVRPIDPDDPADLAQVRLLETEAREAVTDQRGGGRWLLEHPAVGDRWQTVIDDDRNDVLVAHIDDVVVGYIVGVLGDDDVIRIDQVWVTPEARECGFGDELLARTISRATGRGATAVEGQALPGDRHTKNLYERAGIVARLITTFRSLVD